MATRAVSSAGEMTTLNQKYPSGSYSISERPQRYESNFLAPNQCLVYIENKQKFADVDGSTYIARKVRDYIKDDILWYDLVLDTDADGDNTTKRNGLNAVKVTADRIVTDRAFRDIQPRQMYHYATLVSSDIEYPVEARSFVIKSNLDKPLESTSRSALGSGIYGIYLQDQNQASALLSNPNQSVYIIECADAYPVQDKEHGESITTASLNTNRYMDVIIQALRTVDILYIDLGVKEAFFYANSFELKPKTLRVDIGEAYNYAKMVIRTNESPNLLTLWNIVFYRTGDLMTKEILEDILARYAIEYLDQYSVVDTINGEPLHELPINYIMKRLGYDGIIASDLYNNGWNRGCVSYNYNNDGIIRGETARY